jgi:hypothetical protein
MRQWIAIAALTAGAATVAVAAGNRPSAPTGTVRAASAPAVLGVEALMKQPQRHRGQIRVEGVVSVTSPQQHTLALIDTAEFRRCGTVECAPLSLPVRWTGAMPPVAKAVRVQGEIRKVAGKLIFAARTLQPVKLAMARKP